VCPNATYSRPRSCMCWPFHLILLPQNKNFSSVTCCCRCRCLCCWYCCGVAITKCGKIYIHIYYLYLLRFLLPLLLLDTKPQQQQQQQPMQKNICFFLKEATENTKILKRKKKSRNATKCGNLLCFSSLFGNLLNA